jgi:hypothetical protein
MNLKGCGRKQSWPNLRYYPGIFLEGLRKTTKALSQDNRFPCQDLNSGPTEYEAGVLSTRPRRSARSRFALKVFILSRFWVWTYLYVSQRDIAVMLKWKIYFSPATTDSGSLEHRAPATHRTREELGWEETHMKQRSKSKINSGRSEERNR